MKNEKVELLLSKINNVQNDKKRIIKKLKYSTLPLIIYGIGGYAKTVKVFLQEYNIVIAAAYVDSEYYNESKNTWEDIPVYDIDNMNRNLQEYNIIIGFSKYKIAKEKITLLERCKNTYFIDCTLCLDFFDYKYIKRNRNQFYESFTFFEDQISKDTFIAFINAKISGISDDLYDLYSFPQYFPKDIVDLKDDEVFVDCGAFSGDTVEEFINEVDGKYNKIYAFEPDVNAFERLNNYVNENQINQINLFNQGVSNENKKLHFSADPEKGERSLFCESGLEVLEVVSIDDKLNGNRVSFIKMDVEGFELNALKGAAASIKKHKPLLAISMYHKPEDLITLPFYIKELVPEYRFYLRNHLHIAQELVLYAMIK